MSRLLIALTLLFASAAAVGAWWQSIEQTAVSDGACILNADDACLANADNTLIAPGP